MAKVVGGRLIRQNEYFIPYDGIDGEVLAAELPLYLGNDATQRPGAYEDEQTGRLIQGYYITAYRNLTTAMLVDIRADSARRAQDRVLIKNFAQQKQMDCTTTERVQQWRDLTPPGGSTHEA